MRPYLLFLLLVLPSGALSDDAYRGKVRAAFAFEAARLKAQPRIAEAYVAPPAGIPGGARFAEDQPRLYYRFRAGRGGCSGGS